ncbi:chemotaxis response regulator protein-glutamate methylesterase, partial [Enterococcus hirae]
GELLRPGTVLLAPGGLHMELRPSPKGPVVQLFDPVDKGPRPSADRRLKSAAQGMGRNALGVVLTGMGADGAEGLLAIRN